MTGERPIAPGEGPHPVPRDLPDQQAPGEDDAVAERREPVGPLSDLEPENDRTYDEGRYDAEDEPDGPDESLPDTDEAGTGRRGAPRRTGVHPEQPVPDEPSA